jgi:phosphatidylethanolamine/phosphatidyl-N-methylethanolamine N-methyltransferase
MFIQELLKNPKHTGAIAPSSLKLSREIVQCANLTKSQFTVELGFGTGVFTNEILKYMHEDHYLGIDTNESFAAHVQSQFPNATFVQDSAEHLKNILSERNIDTCDRIISGLPWSNFDPTLQSTILTAINESLSKNGTFLTFAYPPFNQGTRGSNFQKELAKRFSNIEKIPILLNIPPAIIYRCTK